MEVLTGAELGHLRDGHPHKISGYLTVIIPEVVYCGQVTGSPDRGDVNIAVSDVSGDITEVQEGQTVYVGTACGEYDISKRRLRSRTGNVLTLDESPLIWSEDWYLTVVDSWELWAVFPYISGGDDFTFYKDLDIEYDDQNQYPPPVAIAGNHKVGYLSGDSIEFDLDASESYAITPGATISSYSWECDGGSIDDDTAATTTITFTTAGTYHLKLTVTDSEGKTQSTRRVIRVHDDDDPPYYDFELEGSIHGDWDGGGWDVSFNVYENADKDDIPDGALVILWYEQYYDDEEVYIGDNGNILFAGYVVEETVTKDVDVGSVKFMAATINEKLDNTNMFSVTLSAVEGAPDSWVEYRSALTVARAVHHYWRWHSTLFDITDVFLPMDNTLTMVAQDFEVGTLYDVIDTFVTEHGIFAHVCCTKDGTVHVKEDIQMLSEADRDAVTTILDITESDRLGDTDVEVLRRAQKETYLIEVGGMNGDGDPFLSQAPGLVPEPVGRDTLSFNGVVLEDQSHANYLSGRLYGIANDEYEEIRVPFAGNYSFIDVIPQYWYTLDVDPGDTKRGISIDRNLVPRDIDMDVDLINGVIKIDVVFEPEAESYDGVAMNVPTTPPIVIDPPELPEVPPWSMPSPIFITPSEDPYFYWTKEVYVVATHDGVMGSTYSDIISVESQGDVCAVVARLTKRCPTTNIHWASGRYRVDGGGWDAAVSATQTCGETKRDWYAEYNAVHNGLTYEEIQDEVDEYWGTTDWPAESTITIGRADTEWQAYTTAGVHGDAGYQSVLEVWYLHYGIEVCIVPDPDLLVLVADGVLLGTDSDGICHELVPGTDYYLETYGGPWNDGSNDRYDVAVSWDGGSTWEQVRTGLQGLGDEFCGVDMGELGPEGYKFTADFDHMSLCIRVNDFDGEFGDNSGRIGYSLHRVAYMHRRWT